jgi:hypothetical protein
MIDELAEVGKSGWDARCRPIRANHRVAQALQVRFAELAVGSLGAHPREPKRGDLSLGGGAEGPSSAAARLRQKSLAKDEKALGTMLRHACLL